MYEQHFGLREKPFALTPDPDFMYLSDGHKLAFNLLEYGLREQVGFVVITGEVGSGKTTLLRRLLSVASEDLVIGLVNNTHPSFGELIRWILLAFDLQAPTDDRVEFHRAFVDFLISQYAVGKRTVLIIDEAQNLAMATLEEVRLLSNINADKDNLLQIILVGQPELFRKLQRPQLRQFVQRIGISYNIEPLDLKNTTNYIRHRLGVAGGSVDIFDDLACAAVYFYSKGIPRLINILCDLSMVYGFAEDRRTIDMDTVIDVATTRLKTGLVNFRGDADATDPEKARKAIPKLLLTRPPNLRPVAAAKD